MSETELNCLSKMLFLDWAIKWMTLDAGSNKNIKDIEILLKRNWNFPKHIFNKNIERNI